MIMIQAARPLDRRALHPCVNGVSHPSMRPADESSQRVLPAPAVTLARHEWHAAEAEPRRQP